jgi:hypothetical protein
MYSTANSRWTPTLDTSRTTAHRGATRGGLALVATALLSFGAVGCSSGIDTAIPDTPTSADTGPITSTETDTVPATSTNTQAGSSVAAGLTDAEVAGLSWMREEEQLAHDVYAALGEVWDLRIFENIAASERSHIDAAIGVLENYGIDDPAAGNEPGTFTDPQIQALYDRLVADGSASLIAALEVGAFIEELDIADLRLRSSATDIEALTNLYANLERGSRNHLRAFTSQLESRDVVYEPTQLDAEAYEEIVSSPTERGHGG